jgi:hypothetical protein
MLFGGVAAVWLPCREASLAGWQLPMHAEYGWSWGALGLWSLLGIGFMIGGVALAEYSRRLYLGGVLVCTNGMRIYTHRTSDDVLWTEIEKIDEVIVYESPPLASVLIKHLLPKIARKAYVVVTKVGNAYRFNEGSIHAIDRLCGVLQKQARRGEIPWETIKLEA